MRTQQNSVKTDVRGTSGLSRDKTKVTTIRSEGAFEAALCTTGAWTAHREGLGAISGRPGDAFGRLLAALGSPGTPQDRLRADIWAFKNHLERISTRSRSALGHPKRPNADLGSIRDGFPSIFGEFVVDFRSSRATSTIHPTACEPTLYTFDQTIPT